MVWSVAGIAVVVALWALLSDRLARWRITPALLMVVTGAAVGFGTHDALAASLDTDVVQPIIEMILAILLFWHATHVRGGFFGGQPGPALRMILVAMPISLLSALALGLWLVPGLPWAAVLVIACVIVPVDFAPVVSLLQDERIPLRVRTLLRVEEGYTDGVVSPVLVFALAVAGGEHSKSEGVLHAIVEGIPHFLIAVALGLGIGAAAATAANAARRHGWMADGSQRLVVLAAPVLAYTLNIGLHGNGFLSAFVCGIAFNGLRRYEDPGRELELIDDVAVVLVSVVWFVFGAVAWYILEDGVPLRTLCYVVLVITVLRFVPVLVALTGTDLQRPERILLAALGPRGTATIVLGLLAFNVTADGVDEVVLSAMILAVLGSVVIHGLSGPAVVGRYANAVSTARNE